MGVSDIEVYVKVLSVGVNDIEVRNERRRKTSIIKTKNSFRRTNGKHSDVKPNNTIRLNKARFSQLVRKRNR